MSQNTPRQSGFIFALSMFVAVGVVSYLPTQNLPEGASFWRGAIYKVPVGADTTVWRGATVHQSGLQ